MWTSDVILSTSVGELELQLGLNQTTEIYFVIWHSQSLPRLTQFENPTTPTKSLLHTNTTSWNTYEVRTHCIIKEEAYAKLRAGL